MLLGRCIRAAGLEVHSVHQDSMLLGRVHATGQATGC